MISHCKNRERPRICFVIDRLMRAGTELHVLNLIGQLDRARLTPYLCLLDGEDDASRSLLPDDCPSIVLGVKKLLSPRAARQALRFWWFLRNNHIDLVQTYFPDSTRFAAPIAKAAGVRAVFGSRRNIGHSMSKTDARIARWYNRSFIDKIFANCEAARRSAIEQENARPEQVVVVPNGIDLDRFKHIPPWSLKTKGGPRRVGMLGNLRHVKGPDLLIDAAKTVVEQYPDICFDIAGGGELAPYNDLVRRLDLADRVRLLGSITDVPSFLSTLDVAVLPSRAEGLSNALLEYMATGRPIVATDVGGNSELLEHNASGLIVPPEDSAALAEAILRLLCDTKLARQLGAHAQGRVYQQHALDTATATYLKYCKEIIA